MPEPARSVAGLVQVVPISLLVIFAALGSFLDAQNIKVRSVPCYQDVSTCMLTGIAVGSWCVM